MLASMTARILIADGSATTRITLKVRLTAACYDVQTAASDAQLQQHLRDGAPDMVLLGTGFAGADIVDTCAQIIRQRPAITVLALTDDARRVAALQAGATAVLDPAVDEQMLLARIRCLLRDAEMASDQPMQMAEPATAFAHAPAGDVVLIADTAARAMRWRHMLQPRLNCRFHIHRPEAALTEVAAGTNADLYVIAADISGRGDGLRLLSELRSRNGSRDAAFVVATEQERDDLAAIALDLGAGDVLPIDLGAGNIESAALALQNQLTRKHRADRRRIDAQKALIWAMTDPLTGLYNRRYAIPRLAQIATETARKGDSFAVVTLDLDHFKDINDSYGHAAGDLVLRDVAARLKAITGDRGVAARLGGEEFLIALPRADEREAYRMAEDIRRMIEERRLSLPALSGGGEISVTVSAGVAITHPAASDAPPDFLAEIALERADRAMMLAKAHGRNRVVLARNEPLSGAPVQTSGGLAVQGAKP